MLDNLDASRFGRRLAPSLALCWLLIGLAAAQQPPVVRIGLLIDGPWQRNQEIRRNFEEAISRLLRGKYDVRFPDDKRIVGDWSESTVVASLDRLMSDPEVDIVITAGIIGSNVAGQRQALPKPVVAPFVLNPLFDVPTRVIQRRQPETVIREMVSGVPNLSFVDFPDNIGQELRILGQLASFEKVTFIVSKVVVDALPVLRQSLAQHATDLEVEHEFVLVEDSLVTALKDRQDIEAAYVGPMFQLTPERLREGIDLLKQRSIPTFSLWGKSVVEEGLLASLSYDPDLPKLSRRIALNIQRILLGERPEDIPVTYEEPQRLVINMETARAIDVSPSFKLLTEAELLNEIRQSGRRLDLASSVREALNSNLDLASFDRAVLAGRQNIRESRSRLYPQAEVSTLTTFIDKDRSQASLGNQGRTTFVNSASISQLIYADGALADLEINKRLQDGLQEDREQLRLDIIQAAATAYLNVLRTKTVESIRKQNLDLTRNNLELARVRQRVGYSGLADVLRWESELATDRRDVIESNSQRNQAEIALNRLLHRPLEEVFTTDEARLQDAQFLTSDPRFARYIDNKRNFRAVRDFLVERSLENSPELRSFDASIAAQRRALLAARRDFWTPDISLQASLSDRRDVDVGGGLELPGAIDPDSLEWTVALNARLPFFEGGAKSARKARAAHQLEQLTSQRAAAAERISQRVRSSAHQAGFSFASIELADDAFRAARRNFELVQDSYSQGVVSVVDLLDAQNASLTADLARADAVYRFLIDWMELQRAIGQFDFRSSRSQRDAWFDRVDEYFLRNGIPVPRR